MTIKTLDKTGHMYYGTSMMAYESVDNCGTCDGAKCDICKDRFKVTVDSTDD